MTLEEMLDSFIPFPHYNWMLFYAIYRLRENISNIDYIIDVKPKSLKLRFFELRTKLTKFDISGQKISNLFLDWF